MSAHDRTARERRLLATILSKNPAFGSKAYLATNPKGISAVELLERMHSPNAPGPGPMQRP